MANLNKQSDYDYKNKMSFNSIVNISKNIDMVFPVSPARPAKGSVNKFTSGWGKIMLVFDFAEK